MQTPSLGVLIEHECPRCGREVELPFGELCDQCHGDIERRARRASRLVAGVTTIVLAIYVFVRMPDVPNARFIGIAGIVAWYVLTGLVVRRTLREVLK